MAIRDRLRILPVRTRVIAAVCALTALALIVSGIVVMIWGRMTTDRRVLEDHQVATAALRHLAAENDPQTGQPWASADALLRAGVQHANLAPAESVMAIADDAVTWTAPAGVTLRPEDDDALIAAVIPVTGRTTVTHGHLSTAVTEWYYTVLPVDVPGQAGHAALVRVTDLTKEYRLHAPIYWAYAIVALVALAIIGLLSWLLVGRLLRPIATVRRTAEEITASDSSQRIPVTGHDDVSALAMTINSMLDRLEAAASEQRQWLDDVGHELRTPATIVRGHLELMDVTDPVEAEETRTIVLSEMDRMRRLVDDLLTLAQSRQPHLLRLELTDLVQLTDDTLTKATGLGDREWQLDSVAEVTTWLDPQRISQAWLQLAANAVQYSDPGSAVALGSAVEDGQVRLWVRDDGQGIEADEQKRIFERHERGSGGTGTGLGLAIVRAIASSHGGDVELESAPGEGSTFTIRFPLRGGPS
ncbi:MAG: HAMP domain-containing histidine kinase [Propionibacteriaceae bacterium]|jgi:signal transduction histidine kinase|nr:HAMP domain-containing histidine kinase [Propionibacteriaceae bacterium]